MASVLPTTLPTEVQSLVLASISNWATLQAVIKASPQYLQTYRGAREIILPQVVKNQISQSPTLIALSRLQLCCRGQLAMPKELALSIAHGRSCNPLNRLPLDFARYFLRFERLVDEYVNEFAQTRLALISSSLVERSNLPYPKSTTEASPLEMSRIRRAFYRLEIFRYINSTAGYQYDQKSAALLPFLKGMPHHELEEFLCVCQFFFDRLHDHINRLETDMMDDFMAAGPNGLASCPPITHERFDSHDWFFSSDIPKSMRDGWREVALTYGLESLKHILGEEDRGTRLEAISAACLSGIEVSRHGLKHLFLPDRRNCCSRKSDVDSARGRDESLQTPNAVYFWLRCDETTRPEDAWYQNHEIIPPLSDPNSQSLRRWGFAVWDRSTLHKFGILAQPLDDVRSIFRRDLTGWEQRPCIEHRFRHQEKLWKEQGVLGEGYGQRVSRSRRW